IGMIASVLAKVPVRVYTLHGLPLETVTGIKRRLYRAAERLTFKCATHRLIVSQSLADRAVQLGVCKETDYQILADGSACGVDRSRFCSANKTDPVVEEIKSRLDIPKDSLVIGFVGRVTPDKGMDCLLGVYEQLSKEHDNLYLLIIGDYDPARTTGPDSYRERIEMHPKIRHVSFVNEIVPYYYTMDLLVLPSKREGFNYALLEAAACGLPTVTTNATGCVDVVADGQTGFIIDSGDFDGFKNAVKRLIKNPRLRLELGQHAEKRVADRFDSKRLIREHTELYEKILD
ncbi:MAG: glycosyltransferase, partial [Planctomycetes bacterium]|nr:glycosyltransferase [Planctomycetota bacterium]